MRRSGFGDRRSLAAAVTPTVDALFGRALSVDAAIVDLLEPFLERDLFPALEAATGQSFSVGAGSVTVRVNEALDTQAYTLTATAGGPLVIEGGSWRGCKHGLYAWLAELGIHQLAPGSRWRTTPSLSDLRRSLSVQRSPSFATIFWQMQGASFGWYPWADPDQFAHRDGWFEWLDWNRRPIAHYTDIVNSTPEKTPLGGHFDQAVWNAKFGVLQTPGAYAQLARNWAQSTTYYAGDQVTANGKRYTCVAKGVSAGSGSGPSTEGAGIADGTTSWNWLSNTVRDSAAGNFHHTHGGPGGVDDVDDYTTIAGLVEEYADVHLDFVDANDAAATDEHADLTMTVGCAVGDGAPTCLDPKCIDMPREVYAASEDARPSDLCIFRNGRIVDRLQALRPGIPILVTDIAYDRQSVPPTIPVPDDMLIEVANWKYQVDGYANSLRLEEWADAAALFGVYDYWSLPAHDNSSARFTAQEAWRRVREVIGLGGTSFHAETTVSAGACGPQWWGLLQLTWRGAGVTDATLLTEWCALAFGAGATHVERMLTRWWMSFPGYTPSAYEFGLAFDDLYQADQAVTGDAGSRSRVAAMQAYLLFLELRFRWYDLAVYATPSQAAAEALGEEFLRFIWSTALTIMVDACWAHDVVLACAQLGATFQDDWEIPTVVGNYAAWRTARGIATLTDAQIRTAFATQRALYTKPTPATYATPGATLVTPYTPSLTTRVLDNYLHGDDLAPDGQTYIFEKRSGSTRTLEVKFYSTQLYTTVRVWLYQAVTGELLSCTDVVIGLYRPENDAPYVTHVVDLAPLAVGYYRLVVEHQAATTFHAMRYYRDVPLVMSSVCARVAWNVGGSPPGNSGYYARFFWVPHGVTAFHVFTTSPNDTDSNTIHVLDSDDVEVVAEQIGDYVYRYEVASGQDSAGWCLEGNLGAGPGHGTARILDLPNWHAPTREQLIVPATLVA